MKIEKKPERYKKIEIMLYHRSFITSSINEPFPPKKSCEMQTKTMNEWKISKDEIKCKKMYIITVYNNLFLFIGPILQ